MTTACFDAHLAAPPTLAAEGLSLAYDRRAVVDGLSLELPTGRITSIVGANGCGKSTLLRGLGRLLKPAAGRVLLGGADISRLAPRAVARDLALLPQSPVAPEGITVADLVGRGRSPHQGLFRRWTAEDERVVAEALHATDTADLAVRRVDELSGGQRQRVWIAMVLAQQPRVLLLDEPTTYLDLAHQVEVLELLARLNAERGTTIVMVLHELNLAARYSDHMVVMGGGRVLRAGVPADVLTEAAVEEAFGLAAVVVSDPVTGGPLVVPR
ncbi:iron-dicitrate ABC transporter ATP-binding protein [Nocardioides phosphati]|uniref:Iron-dicitrate ABC transporter ATP-binding protein n=1 Tax=Nocardioides phosphati TaxID=1867775 RepID=A0ABQ2N7B6_9ACTN|nr:ABC transporter ATP-binding protein [Nocardioides phosphati]GGO85925.1 iron-dicitrate ABC transporter ATP-binding protein [Nocardioides phosphati]